MQSKEKPIHQFLDEMTNAGFDFRFQVVSNKGDVIEGIVLPKNKDDGDEAKNRKKIIKRYNVRKPESL